VFGFVKQIPSEAQRRRSPASREKGVGKGPCPRLSTQKPRRAFSCSGSTRTASSPLKEKTWKESARAKMKRYITAYVVSRFAGCWCKPARCHAEVLAEIANMWRFTRNNGITEGFHNKMETISRVAYGFRNFENYRLRVKVLCS
jgi:transposase